MSLAFDAYPSAATAGIIPDGLVANDDFGPVDDWYFGVDAVASPGGVTGDAPAAQASRAGRVRPFLPAVWREYCATRAFDDCLAAGGDWYDAADAQLAAAGLCQPLLGEWRRRARRRWARYIHADPDIVRRDLLAHGIVEPHAQPVGQSPQGIAADRGRVEWPAGQGGIVRHGDRFTTDAAAGHGNSAALSCPSPPADGASLKASPVDWGNLTRAERILLGSIGLGVLVLMVSLIARVMP